MTASLNASVLSNDFVTSTIATSGDRSTTERAVMRLSLITGCVRSAQADCFPDAGGSGGLGCGLEILMAVIGVVFVGMVI